MKTKHCRQRRPLKKRPKKSFYTRATLLRPRTKSAARRDDIGDSKASGYATRVHIRHHPQAMVMQQFNGVESSVPLNPAPHRSRHTQPPRSQAQRKSLEEGRWMGQGCPVECRQGYLLPRLDQGFAKSNHRIGRAAGLLGDGRNRVNNLHLLSSPLSIIFQDTTHRPVAKPEAKARSKLPGTKTTPAKSAASTPASPVHHSGQTPAASAAPGWQSLIWGAAGWIAAKAGPGLRPTRICSENP